MSDLTYTAQGTFDNKRKATINVCIPPKTLLGTYRTEIYNLSKITSNGSVNVIFCHFSDGTSIAMQHDRFDYRLNFNLDPLIKYDEAVDFDATNEDALFLFFHNDNFELSDRDYYFKNCEVIIEDIKNNGNQSRDGVTKHATAGNPRKVGMSLITKL